MHLFIYAIMVFVLFGCSWFSKSQSQEIIDVPPPRILQSLAPKKPSRKEPGSLWSEESKWNEIYSVGSTRKPGDIITVKVTESLKSRIAMTVAAKTGKPIADIRNGGEPLPTPEPKKESSQRNPASEKEGGKVPGQDTKQPEKEPETAKKTPNLDTKSFEATILEVLPNGIYRIASNQGLKVGGPSEPYVSLEGNVREKEVSPDDTVSSDVLLGTKIDVLDNSNPNVISNN